MMLAAERLFLAKVASLDRFVERVTKEGKKNIKVQLPGHDELSKLADSVDGMADSLEISKNELKKYTEKLELLVEERSKKLKDAERLAAIGETTTWLGHDLRNPLQSVVNTIYLMKETLGSSQIGKEKEDLERSLARLERNTSYMDKIVSDLSEYASPLYLNIVHTDVPSLISETIADISPPPGINIKTELMACSANLDPMIMRRALTNIITNAIQSMASGGEVTITNSSSENGITIEVKDTGNGIPPEIMGMIFKPFFTRKSKGMGMGLPVAKRLVEAHGGTVSVKSEVGKGTAVAVWLPSDTQPKTEEQRMYFIFEGIRQSIQFA
jgi:signal transduction histidine kinase